MKVIKSCKERFDPEPERPFKKGDIVRVTFANGNTYVVFVNHIVSPTLLQGIVLDTSRKTGTWCLNDTVTFAPRDTTLLPDAMLVTNEGC